MSVRRPVFRIVSVLLLAVVVTSFALPRAQGRMAPAALELFDVSRGAAAQATLPTSMREISGLATTADGRVYAHGDERAVVAQIDACAATVVKSFALGRPALRGDFEGMAIAGDRFFLITSTGLLYEFREGAEGAVVPFSVIDTGFGKACELEGLAYDANARVLIIGCKESPRPELRGRVTLLRWSLDSRSPAAPPNLTIPLGDVVKVSGTKGFRTSAIERHASSGNYLLVAGPERMLLEVTPKGTLVAGRALPRQLHKQPEGLTFLGDSLLAIADEGGTGRATMTCYPRVP